VGESNTCAERGCPFPPKSGENYCRSHVAMFSVPEEDADVSAFNLEIESLRLRVGCPEGQNSKRDIKFAFCFAGGDYERGGASIKRVHQRSVGFCLCGSRAVDPNKSCESCLMEGRYRFHRAIARGLCVSCYNKPPLPGDRRCFFCRERTRANQERHRVERRAKGLCAGCGGLRSTPALRCEECLARGRKSHKRRYRFLLAVSLCTVCGRKRENLSVRKCKSCTRKVATLFSKRNKKIRLQRKVAGLCTTCGGLRDRDILTCSACTKYLRSFGSYRRKRSGR
jgi:hypothetical protein